MKCSEAAVTCGRVSTYLKSMILYCKTYLKFIKLPKTTWTLYICEHGCYAYNTQTSHSHWPKMTPYRVNDWIVYEVTDMVRYLPGWAVPSFASSLLKGMIKYNTARLSLTEYSNPPNPGPTMVPTPQNNSSKPCSNESKTKLSRDRGLNFGLTICCLPQLKLYCCFCHYDLGLRPVSGARCRKLEPNLAPMPKRWLKN